MRRLPAFLIALPLLAAAPPAFIEHTIASDLKGGYQVVVADLNHDGTPDLIALASGLHELVWFENPGWQRHVLATGQNRMINCAVIGDEIVLASEFANQAKDSIGIVSVLRPNGDPREPWTATEIDRLTTSHRLRVADIFGNGKPVVINAALTGAKPQRARLSRPDAARLLRSRRVEAARHQHGKLRRGPRHLHRRLGRHGPRQHAHGQFHRHPPIPIRKGRQVDAHRDRQGGSRAVAEVADRAISRSAISAKPASSPPSSPGTATRSPSIPSAAVSGSAT